MLENGKREREEVKKNKTARKGSLNRGLNSELSGSRVYESARISVLHVPHLDRTSLQVRCYHLHPVHSCTRVTVYRLCSLQYSYVPSRSPRTLIKPGQMKNGCARLQLIRNTRPSCSTCSTHVPRTHTHIRAFWNKCLRVMRDLMTRLWNVVHSMRVCIQRNEVHCVLSISSLANRSCSKIPLRVKPTWNWASNEILSCNCSPEATLT